MAKREVLSIRESNPGLPRAVKEMTGGYLSRWTNQEDEGGGPHWPGRSSEHLIFPFPSDARGTQLVSLHACSTSSFTPVQGLSLALTEKGTKPQSDLGQEGKVPPCLFASLPLSLPDVPACSLDL